MGVDWGSGCTIYHKFFECRVAKMGSYFPVRQSVSYTMRTLHVLARVIINSFFLGRRVCVGGTSDRFSTFTEAEYIM